MEESKGYIAIKSTNKTKVTAMLRFSMSQIIDQFLLNQLQQILWTHHHSLEPVLLANRPHRAHTSTTWHPPRKPLRPPKFTGCSPRDNSLNK